MYVRSVKRTEQSPEQREDVLRRATGSMHRVGPEALSSILDLDGAGTLARIRAGRRAAWRVRGGAGGGGHALG